jgi:hypothetical protein
MLGWVTEQQDLCLTYKRLQVDMSMVGGNGFEPFLRDQGR